MVTSGGIVGRLKGSCRMLSTLPLLLGSVWVGLGVERVTLDSDVGDKASRLYDGKLAGSKSVGSYPALQSSSNRLHALAWCSMI